MLFKEEEFGQYVTTLPENQKPKKPKLYGEVLASGQKTLFVFRFSSSFFVFFFWGGLDS